MKTLIATMSTLAILVGSSAAFAAEAQYPDDIPADIFVKADRNHDGKLSPAELKRAETLMSWNTRHGDGNSDVIRVK